MRLTGIRITNYFRFRGTSELDLGPGVHAVVAEYEDDELRSNWAGKSSFLSAIRFGLFGVIPRKMVDTLDEAIHHGADELGVELEFDNGLFITRAKKRGKPVQLTAFIPDSEAGGEVELTQAAAQERVEELLRLDEDDFLATSYFEQRQTSRFILADPADRTAIVNGWLKLDPLQDAAEIASAELTRLLNEESQITTERARLDAELAALGCDSFELGVKAAQRNLTELTEEFEAEQAEYTRQVEARTKMVEVHAKAKSEYRAQRGEWDRHKQASDKHGQLVGQRDQARADQQEKQDETAAREALDTATVIYKQAVEECEAKEKLARGQFDGICPVNCEVCPMVDDINLAADKNAKLHEQAVSRQLNARGELDAAKKWLQKLIDCNHEVDRLARRIESLTERLDDLAESTMYIAKHPEPPPEPKLPEIPPMPETPAGARRVADAQAHLDRMKWSEGRVDELAEERDALAGRIAAQRLAVAIVGRNGAQKRVSQGALSLIEGRANRRLATAGIPLTVTAQWGRETKQLEVVCSSCGHAFPKSARVKACERCGSERGRKTDGKLHIRLSNRSGAAEDLAGLAFQLAAARWLRERRGSPLSAVVLDEPFGALDESNKKSLAASLTSLLGDGFDQAFVVAHDRGILDALPHRIRIIAHADHSTIELG